jgi:UDP-N-acetylglucosamine:LPS N-acetylglucosamine transferase
MDKKKIKNITILYTNSGAGHKTVTQSLYDEFITHKDVAVKKVNFAKEFNIKGFANSEKSYKFFVKYFPYIYGAIVDIANIDLVTQFLKFMYRKPSEKMVKRFVQKYDSDLYISTYYFDIELFKEIKLLRPKAKFIIIVTDIVFPLRIWFDPKIDLTIVPTDEMYVNAKQYFLKYENKINVLGLPISAEYYKKYDPQIIRKNLNLNSDKTILISGGGEGMAKIADILSAIDNSHNNLNIVVICGKDEKLYHKLIKSKYKNHVIVKGWVNNFDEYLKACDIAITKAGPTTLWECITLGKQMIIYDYIKGQENGNVEFATKYGGAIYENDVEKIPALIENLKPSIKPNTKFTKNYAKSFVKIILSNNM